MTTVIRMDVARAAAQARKPIDHQLRDSGNVWRWDGANLWISWRTIDRTRPDEDLYCIPFADRPDPLEWLAQIEEKVWASDKVIADLARAFAVIGALR